MTKIVETPIVEQYLKDQQTFFLYVFNNRFMPGPKDGLKPVHRRILYCVYHDNKAITHAVKSQSITGSTIAKYHPHGDTSVYAAMKPMVNWFEINMPLLEKKGSFGNIQGESPSAARYTEAKLSKFSYENVIGELVESDKVVDWIPNYDRSCYEPEFLPVKVPLLLINGFFAIIPAFQVHVPQHNIVEVINATINLIDNPDAPVVLIPDTSMPCHIIESDFVSISNKGHGSYRVRGIVNIIEYKGKPTLEVRSVPNLTTFESISKAIHELVEKKKLIQIQDMESHSSENELRELIILKKGSDPNFVREVLYKNTPLEKTHTVNFEIMNPDGVNQIRMSYKSYLESFIEFRKLTKFRMFCSELQDIRTKMHERETYVHVIQSGKIDKIIQRIKVQKTIGNGPIMDYMINELKLTDVQASFIISADLPKLSEAYVKKYIDDIAVLKGREEICLELILNEHKLLEVIKSELITIRDKWKKPRNSIVIANTKTSSIPKGLFNIVITENNYIRKLIPTENINVIRDDKPKFVLKCDNTENILLADEVGRVFKLPVHKISMTDKNMAGTDIRMLCKNLTSNISSIFYEPTIKQAKAIETTNKHFIVVVTKSGCIKALTVDDFIGVPPSGKVYVKLDSGDSVVDVTIVPHSASVVLFSYNKALRIPVLDLPFLKCNAKGYKGMNTDVIEGMSCIHPNTSDIVVLTEFGYVNRFNGDGLPVSVRGKSGSNVIRLHKGDKIKSVFSVNPNETITVVTKNGNIDLLVSDIQYSTSVSPGFKMLPIKNDIVLKSFVRR